MEQMMLDLVILFLYVMIVNCNSKTPRKADENVTNVSGIQEATKTDTQQKNLNVCVVMLHC